MTLSSISANNFSGFVNAFEDRTTIMISHNIELLKGMDRILVLDQGRIIQEGSFAELAEEKGIFSEIIRQSQSGLTK